MRLTKETLKRIIKEELEESRLRRHLRNKGPAASPVHSQGEIQKVIKHPFMKYYLKGYFQSLGREGIEELHDVARKMGLSTKDTGMYNDPELNERELLGMIESKLAADNRELAIAVVKQMMAEGTLDEEFLLAAGIK